MNWDDFGNMWSEHGWVVTLMRVVTNPRLVQWIAGFVVRLLLLALCGLEGVVPFLVLLLIGMVGGILFEVVASLFGV